MIKNKIRLLFLFVLLVQFFTYTVNAGIGTKNSPKELNLLVESLFSSNLAVTEKNKTRVQLQNFNQTFIKVDKIDLFVITKVVIYKSVSRSIDSNSLFSFNDLKNSLTNIEKMNLDSYSPFLRWIISANIADIQDLTKSEARFKKEPRAKIKLIGKISELIIRNSKESFNEIMIPIMLEILTTIERYVDLYIKYTPHEPTGKKLLFFNFENQALKMKVSDELDKIIAPALSGEVAPTPSIPLDNWKPKNDFKNPKDINYTKPNALPEIVNDWGEDNDTLIQSVIYDYVPPSVLPKSVDDWKTNKELNNSDSQYIKPQRLPMPVEDWSDVEEIKKIDYGIDLDSDSTIY